MSEHAPTKRTYWLVAAALFVLLGLTVGVSRLPLGPFGPLAAMLIASAKAALIALYFMHMRYSSPVMRLFAASGVVWLAILIGLTLVDVAART